MVLGARDSSLSPGHPFLLNRWCHFATQAVERFKLWATSFWVLPCFICIMANFRSVNKVSVICFFLRLELANVADLLRCIDGSVVKVLYDVLMVVQLAFYTMY